MQRLAGHARLARLGRRRGDPAENDLAAKAPTAPSTMRADGVALDGDDVRLQAAAAAAQYAVITISAGGNKRGPKRPKPARARRNAGHGRLRDVDTTRRYANALTFRESLVRSRRVVDM